LQNKNYIGGIISLLLGLSIGFTALSFFYIFASYYPQGFIQSLLFAFFATIPGLIIIVLLEFVLLGYAKFEENKIQTKLLEDILKELQTKETNAQE